MMPAVSRNATPSCARSRRQRPLERVTMRHDPARDVFDDGVRGARRLPSELYLSAPRVGAVPGNVGEAIVGGQNKSRLELWWWIVAVAALPLLLIEWWVYTRRVHL